MKRQTSISLTDEGHAMVNALVKKLGVSRNAVIEMAVRDKAEREGVEQTQGGPTRVKPGTQK